MFYEYKCLECGEEVVISKLIKNVAIIEVCPNCGSNLQRVYSPPNVHMQRMIAEGVMRTDEPPDEMKPDTYHWDTEKHLVSYPGKAVKRKKGMKN